MPRLNHSIRAISFIAVVATFSVEPAYADAALIAWIRDRKESLWSLSRRRQNGREHQS
jgi:hypothetical protein